MGRDPSYKPMSEQRPYIMQIMQQEAHMNCKLQWGNLDISRICVQTAIDD